MEAEALKILQMKALESITRAENTAKYFSLLIEKTRIELGIPVKEYTELLNYTSPTAYRKAFQALGKKFGTTDLLTVLQFCYLFGYDLNVPEEEIILPHTRTDFYSLEISAIFSSLPKKVMDDVIYAISESDGFEENPADKAVVVRTLNTMKSYIYDEEKYVIPFRYKRDLSANADVLDALKRSLGNTETQPAPNPDNDNKQSTAAEDSI